MVDRSLRICRNLRELRKARNLTLAELSRLSDVSISTLSKIETQQVQPSFDTILKLSQAFGVGFEAFVGSPEEQPPAALKSVTRSGGGEQFTTSRYRYNVHSSDIRRKRMIPLIMEIVSREPPKPEEWSSHEGEEFIYVVSGRVALHTEYYEPSILEAGDSAYINSLMPHAFVNLGDGEARIISVCFTDHLYFPPQPVRTVSSDQDDALRRHLAEKAVSRAAATMGADLSRQSENPEATTKEGKRNETTTT